ncbi:hypothetical protein PENSTE_c034G04413 [Penicillium steckii]|uniref:Uncharacterized protein n=1 Tax=Penicillium steckii TaxID=303698 RepID=A0A1V6SLP2_9EURO|nr:hypothetical protein PENSTE_c034G04413 [Penicillium steckii]
MSTFTEINGSDLISALHLAQQAPVILGPNPKSTTSSTGTAEEYGRIEQLFLACLRTGDDQSASTCLNRLSHRFGPANERVMGLHGLYQEATAKDRAALEKIREEYEKILNENPVNVPIMKRRIALLRSLDRPTDAIAALIQLLDALPTDAEAWCELADLYQAQGLGSQAIFSLEEALLIAPNAWNIHARLGELLYVSSSSPDSDAPRLVSKSVQHFSRSIELCDDYLRGFYGLILATTRMIEDGHADNKTTNGVSRTTLEALKRFGIQRLGEIVQSRSVDDQHWASSRSELIAAKEYNISIGRLDPDDEDQFLSDEEDSSGVHVVAPSIPGSHDPDYDDWDDIQYPEEIKPSDSASRPRTSHHNRSIHGSRSASARRPHSRRMEPSYPSSRARGRPTSPESADSAESDEYPPQYQRRDHHRWPPVPPVAPAPNYAPSASSGQTFGGYPPGTAAPPPPPHPAYPHPNGAVPSDTLVRHANPGAQPYGYPPYAHQYQGHPGAGMHHPFYPQDPAAHSRHPRQPHHPSQQPMPHPMGMHGSASPFGASPFQHEMVPYGANGYYNYTRDPYAMMAAMQQQSYFPQFQQIPSPQQHEPAPAPTPAPAAASPAPAPAPDPTPPPPADTAKDEAIARLEKLILDDRTEREAKEAAKIAEAERKAAEAAALEAQLAHDRKIAGEAAALARADAEKRAAEEAAKAKEEAEKAAAAAASEAAAAATAAATAAAAEAANAAAAEAEKAAAPPPPPEKKKPIKFKDAVGRKFSFPFELCATWQGMEDLIKQAFLHIEVIGPHVADGHYDLVGPNGDIILPQVWETVIEPDWSITMHMWPIPEKPKDPDPPPAEAPPPAEPPKADASPPAEPPKKPAPKKPRPNGQPSGFASWMMGGRKPPRPKAAPKKAEAAPAAPAPAP